MPKKVRSSITGDSERRRRAEIQRQRREKERLRREKEDPLAAEKRRRLNAEYQRRRKEIKNQIEAENRSRLAENRKRLIAEHYRAKNLAHSKKDGDVSKWQKKQIPEGIRVKGRRIIDFQYFFKAIKDVNNHSKAGCNLNDIFIESENIHGICTSYCLKCAVCNFEKDIWSENPNDIRKNLNMEFLWGVMSMKCSFKDANALLSKMRLPLFSKENVYVPFTTLGSNKICQNENTPQNLRENVQTEPQLTAVEQRTSASGNSGLLERMDLSGWIVEDKFEIGEETVIENINESESIIPDQRVRISDYKLIAGQEQVLTHNNKTCQNISKNLVENGQNIIENKYKPENIILGQRVRTSDDKLIADQEQVILNVTTIKQEINSDDEDLTSSVTNETKRKESKIDNYEQSVFRAIPILSQQNEERACEKRMIVNQEQINLQNVIENKNEPENIILGQRVRTSDDKLIAGQEQVILNVKTIKQEINSDDEDLTSSVTNETKSKESKIDNYEQSVFGAVPILSQQNEERACKKRMIVNQGQINFQLIGSQEQVITHNSKACQNIPKNSGENVQRESQLTAVEQCSPTSGNSSLLQRMDLNGLVIEEQFEIKEENVIEDINESESIILDPRMRTSDDKMIAGQEQVITHNDKTCQNIPKNLGENVQGEKHCSCASGNSSLLEQVHLGAVIVEDQFKIKEENVIENINESETIILDQRIGTSDDKLIAGREQVITHSKKTCQNTPKNLGENVQRESQLTAVKQCSPASGNSSLLEQVDLDDLIVEDQFEIKEETVVENLNESESIILGPRMGTSDDKLISGQEQAILNMTIKQEINSDDEDLTSSVTSETKSKESKIDNYEQSVFRTVPILSQQNEEVACEKRMIVNQGQINLQNIIEIKNEPENLIIGQRVRTSDDKLIADQEQIILNMSTIKQEINSDDEGLTSSVTNETKSKESRIDNYEQSVLVPILSQQNEERACEKRMIDNQVNNILVKPDDNTIEIIDIDSMTDFDYKLESELPRKKTRTEIYKDLYHPANRQKFSRILKKGINIFQNRLDSNGFVTATSTTTARGSVTSTSSITSGENVTATSSMTTRGGDITSLIPVQHSPKSNESSALIVPQMPHNIARETNKGLGGTASISGVPSAIQQPANASGATHVLLVSTVVQQPVNLSNSMPGAIPAANWQCTSSSNVVSNASGSNICTQQPVKSSNSISRVMPATNIVQNANRSKLRVLQPKPFSNIPRVKTVTNIVRKANTRKIYVVKRRVKSPKSPGIPGVKPGTDIVQYANGTTYAVL